MIKPLQSLRFIAITGVFLSHLFTVQNTYPVFFENYFNFGYCGVTFFILLSGFVMAYNYFDKFEYANMKTSILFCKKRLKKIYPVHIITLLIALPLAYKTIINSPVDQLLKLLINASLIQSFIPKVSIYFSFNAVSWFLSVSFFFYILTPYLLQYAHAIKTKRIIFLLILFIYVIEIFLVFLWRNNVHSHWLFYISPFFRLFDYTIGILIGLFIKKLSTENDKKIKCRLFTLLEAVSIVTFIIIYLFSPKIPKVATYGIYYIPVMLLLIIIFSIQQGYISKLLSNRLLVYLGGISFEFYMIHPLILTYITHFTKQNHPILISVICYVFSLVSAIGMNKAINILHEKIRKI